jgi:hypothetical protein
MRTSSGSGAAVTQTDRAHPSSDDGVLLAVAVVAQHPLAEVLVDGGVGAAACRAGERERAYAVTLAAHQ